MRTFWRYIQKERKWIFHFALHEQLFGRLKLAIAAGNQFNDTVTSVVEVVIRTSASISETWMWTVVPTTIQSKSSNFENYSSQVLNRWSISRVLASGLLDLSLCIWNLHLSTRVVILESHRIQIALATLHLTAMICLRMHCRIVAISAPRFIQYIAHMWLSAWVSSIPSTWGGAFVSRTFRIQ